jgi:hypothetical protein
VVDQWHKQAQGAAASLTHQMHVNTSKCRSPAVWTVISQALIVMEMCWPWYSRRGLRHFPSRYDTLWFQFSGLIVRKITAGIQAIAIVCGGYHACALISGGGVKCWGWNDYWMLGTGSNVQQNSPVDVLLGGQCSVMACGEGMASRRDLMTVARGYDAKIRTF